MDYRLNLCSDVCLVSFFISFYFRNLHAHRSFPRLACVYVCVYKTLHNSIASSSLINSKISCPNGTPTKFSTATGHDFFQNVQSKEKAHKSYGIFVVVSSSDSPTRTARSIRYYGKMPAAEVSILSEKLWLAYENQQRVRLTKKIKVHYNLKKLHVATT